MIAKLLLLHFLADSILQPREMARKKSQDLGWLFGHLAIQFVVFLPFTSLWFALINCAIHGVVDWFLWRGYKLSVVLRFPEFKNKTEKAASSYPYWEDDLFYKTIMLDQLLHGLTLVFLAGRLL